MPTALALDGARYDSLGIENAENASTQNHHTRSTANPRKSSQTARAALGENPNGAHGSPKVMLEALSSDAESTVKSHQVVGRTYPMQSSNGWQESEGEVSNADRNDWTQVKRKGSLRSKKKRQSEDTFSAEEMESPSLLREADKGKVSKLPRDKLLELTSSPDALPLQSPKSVSEGTPSFRNRAVSATLAAALEADEDLDRPPRPSGSQSEVSPRLGEDNSLQSPPLSYGKALSDRPGLHNRAASSPLLKRKVSNPKANGVTPISIPKTRQGRATLEPLNGRDARVDSKAAKSDELLTSPLSHSIPIPPLSVPTHLHLELSSHKPSPLYLNRPSDSEFPYEPTHVKLERLRNFLLLPPQLEQVLWFGTLACFDAWLYTFTILPIRFAKATSNLALSLLWNLWAEIAFVTSFIYAGAGRVWKRATMKSASSAQGATSMNGKTPDRVKVRARMPSPAGRADIWSSESTSGSKTLQPESSRARPFKGHRRTRSEPSNLLSVEKADILKGLLIVISCYILMYFDASMIYHNIRGQAAIKLYVIYNALEVFDRLFSALGQDILECLFAKETLDRKPNGRSKIIRPFWLFLLALIYNIIHSTALFYQVITLNVAVNSYSNALLTLLMSNQFVEIKSTVFKKIEKENLFQMTCADVVERFQLWLMLIIIAARNIVETGGLLSTGGGSSSIENTSSLLPHSFTLLPDWVGQVMSPFFFVLGTETLVDWVKHAYITKFNATKPNIYGRFLDVLAKDYYSNAFTDPNLTRRVGLPTIPLSCLFIRASVQTYHMFLATHASAPTSPSSTTSLTEDYANPESTPAITAAIQHIDRLFKRAIFGTDPATPEPPINIPYLSSINPYLPSLDTILTHLTTLVFFTLLFLVLLILKILLGMALLSFARNRYAGMKAREQESSHVDSKRFGGWGMVETGDERRKWIYEDDTEGLRKKRERERDTREKEAKGGVKGLGGVERYSMVAKRIW